ncbi:MAG: 50S ribosomal protein L28 [Candidatus Sungbacteria bacterium]|uniref:50S ribosomal protein L28 n=1 Tax=Candidatus Sungiibacteriota bacterium TaxID=2750080 RepID=A0A931SAU9_9BACT|nr:50S ribosomal protein L28 [Candidatus Sungbacteria bacterium]
MKICAICQKGSHLGGVRKLLRGHYNPTTTKRVYPNLQWVRLVNSHKRVKACAKCIKALAKKTK